jgi:hypothetical protein
MLVRKPTAASFAIAFALAYHPSSGVAEMPDWKPVPPGDEIEWATIAIRGFSGHECGEVVEAKRLADGTIRAKCHSGEYFRIALKDGAPIAIWCAEAEKQGIKDC